MDFDPHFSLPIRSNRISWKRSAGTVETKKATTPNPYLLGQIGLVGNLSGAVPPGNSSYEKPYLLGQIGLVERPKKGFF